MARFKIGESSVVALLAAKRRASLGKFREPKVVLAEQCSALRFAGRILPFPGHLTVLSSSNWTGPNKPAGSSGVLAVSLRMLVCVNRCSFGRLASPMMRLG